VIDVLVAGGGPAGLATAIRCAQSGLSVTVVDPRAFPIDKACGEGLMPAAVRRLSDFGVSVTGHPIRGIRYLDHARHADAPFRRGEGRGVRRTELHAALSTRASDLGVQLIRGFVNADISQDEAGVTVTLRPRGGAGARARAGAGTWTGTEAGAQADAGAGPGEQAGAGEEIRARYLVAADGLHSPIRRFLGLDARVPAGSPVAIARADRPSSPAADRDASGARSSTASPDSRFGLRQHFRIAPWTDRVEVYWARPGEAYVTPVSDDMVGVAILGGSCAREGTADNGFGSRLAAFPALRERLCGATTVTRVLGAGPMRQRTPRRVAGRVLLVGDAAGYVDALTGEGIGAALAQAEVLARCLAASRPGDYERAWQRVTRKGWALTSGLLWSRNQPLLAPRIVPAAAQLPWLFAAIVNEVAWA
jgi:flavin-dependent dehydrogenase